MNIKDLTDKRFGTITVLYRDLNVPMKRGFWFCLCDCGRKIRTQARSLRRIEEEKGKFLCSCQCAKSGIVFRKEEAAENLKQQTKSCRSCNKIKKFSSFSNQRDSLDGKRTLCKDCSSWENRRLDEEAFILIAENQNWLCGNPRCFRSITKSSHIDHNHKTGKVRGILCRGCNTSLGQCEEDRERILGLTEYLERE